MGLFRLVVHPFVPPKTRWMHPAQAGEYYSTGPDGVSSRALGAGPRSASNGISLSSGDIYSTAEDSGQKPSGHERSTLPGNGGMSECGPHCARWWDGKAPGAKVPCRGSTSMRR